MLIAAGRAEFLSAAGSERAAKYELAALKAEWKERGIQPWHLSRVECFLIPGKSTYWRDTDPRKAISTQVQADIFEAINGAVRDDLGFHELGMLMDVFEKLHRDETKETLRRLLKHPSTTFVNRAVYLLNRMDERVEPVAPAPPVRFRIYLNDEPWRSAELSYRMVDTKVPHLGGGSVKTDAEGFATIPRDEFLDASKRGMRMKFGQIPTRSGGSRWSARPFDDPWVNAEINVPQVLDGLTVVHLSACQLPIEIEW